MSGTPADDDLVADLFPIRGAAPDGRSRRPPRLRRSSRPKQLDQPGRPMQPSRPGPDPHSQHSREAARTHGWRPAVAVGLCCGALALLLRLALSAALPPADVHRLPGTWLWLGALALACVFCLCSRLGASAVVCLAGALAIAVADVAAPFGIALLLVAVWASRRAVSRPGAQNGRETNHDPRAP